MPRKQRLSPWCSSWLQAKCPSTQQNEAYVLGCYTLSNNIVKLQHTCLQVHVCMLTMRLQMPGYNTPGLCTQKNRGSKAKKTPQRLAAGFGQDMN